MIFLGRRKYYLRYLSKLGVNLNEVHCFFIYIHLKSPVDGRITNNSKQHIYHCDELTVTLFKTQENSKHTTSHSQSNLLEKLDSSDENRIVLVTESQQDRTKLQLDNDTHSDLFPTTSPINFGMDSLSATIFFRRMVSKYNVDPQTVSIRTFFKQDTIGDQIKLMKEAGSKNTQSIKWQQLHLIKGITSFAQERIFLDEQVRFTKEIAVYNELIALRILRGSISITRLTRALRSVVYKHKILRTSFTFNNNDNTLNQLVTDDHDTFTLVSEKMYKNDDELNDIISQITMDPNLFDLSNGRVLFCQILKHQSSNNDENSDTLLAISDIFIVAFHHIVFDGSTFPIFLNYLSRAYNDNTECSENEDLLQYIDYSVHERLTDMSPSCTFWSHHLNGYNTDCRLALPVDRHNSFDRQRSGYAYVTEVFFKKETSTAFMNYASSHQTTVFQLSLAIFYAFLFKLSHHQYDLCVSCFNANRYKPELQSMLGMFVATSPCRVQMDSSWSFNELVQHVREHCLSIMEHSHYPLQHIIADLHLESSKVPFLELLFHFINISPDTSYFNLNETNLEQVTLAPSSEVSKFDFMLKFVYDSTSDDRKLSFRLICSQDLYNENTVKITARRFKQIFEQLFTPYTSDEQIAPSDTLVIELDLILPEEQNEIQNTIFSPKITTLNEGML
ncbi:unnamed protein product [Adineta ricciae]|uniref:Condensation domain-containing protein n=1 Tax=Adineta ricciae TaxID=249248 RepID=A0A815X771_ADIRI|nr:unnamed protein product [Adineta ricciae]